MHTRTLTDMYVACRYLRCVKPTDDGPSWHISGGHPVQVVTAAPWTNYAWPLARTARTWPQIRSTQLPIFHRYMNILLQIKC